MGDYAVLKHYFRIRRIFAIFIYILSLYVIQQQKNLSVYFDYI